MTELSVDPLTVAQAPDPSPNAALAPVELILRNSVAIGLSTLAAKALMFVWQLLLARALGAAGYGMYGTIGALLAVGATIPDLGMGLVVIREVARQPRDSGRYLGATATLQPPLALLAYALVVLGAYLLGYDTPLRAVLLLAGLSLLIDVVGNMCHNQLIAAEKMTAPAVISVAHVVLIMLLSGAALLAKWGLWGVYAGILAAGIARSAAYWMALRRTGCRPKWPASGGLLRGLALAGLPLATMAFLSLADMHADKLLTTALVGTEGTGFLTAAFVIVFGVMELLSTPMLIVTFPALSRARGPGRSEAFGELVEKLASFHLLFGLPLAACISLLAVPFAGMLFGGGFSRTGEVLSVLIWYAVLAMESNVFAQALIAGDETRRLVVVRSLGLAVNVALGLLLIPARGVTGAALAAVLAEAFSLAGLFVAVRLPLARRLSLGDRVWRLIAASVGLLVVMLWLRRPSPWIAAAAALPAYALLVWLSGAMKKGDWTLLRRLVAAIPGMSALDY